jgi:hypothetical protein
MAPPFFLFPVLRHILKIGGFTEIRLFTGEHRLRLSTMFEAKLKVVPVNPNDRVK